MVFVTNQNSNLRQWWIVVILQGKKKVVLLLILQIHFFKEKSIQISIFQVVFKYSLFEDSEESHFTLILPADQIFNILSQDPLQNCMNRNILLKVDPDRHCKPY